MLKKIFIAALMMTAIIFVGNAKVSAQDVWFHTDQSGMEYYIVTETLANQTDMQRHGSLEFEATIKYVRGDSLVSTKKYHIHEGEGGIEYTIDGSESRTAGNRTPEGAVALAFRNYCHQYFDIEKDYFRMGGN